MNRAAIPRNPRRITSQRPEPVGAGSSRISSPSFASWFARSISLTLMLAMRFSSAVRYGGGCGKKGTAGPSNYARELEVAAGIPQEEKVHGPRHLGGPDALRAAPLRRGVLPDGHPDVPAGRFRGDLPHRRRAQG